MGICFPVRLFTENNTDMLIPAFWQVFPSRGTSGFSSYRKEYLLHLHLLWSLAGFIPEAARGKCLFASLICTSVFIKPEEKTHMALTTLYIKFTNVELLHKEH